MTCVKGLMAGAALMLPIVVAAPAIAADSGIFLYGQFNYGGIFYDDGVDSDSYFVDNANSNTRLGIDLIAPEDGFGQLRFNFESGIGTTLSDSVNQLTGNDFDLDWDKTKLRKFEFIYTTNNYGTLYLGQGSMASDGISYSDFSGTGLVATVSAQDAMGGQLFRHSDGTLSNVSFGSAQSDFDGARRFRVRYDTPTFNGFTLSGAYGQDILNDNDDRDYFDAALRYSGESGDFKYGGGLGYNWRSGTDNFGSVSAGVLHKPTGLNATVVAGRNDNDGKMLYGKVGIIQSFFGDDAYKTAFSVDYYSGDSVNGRDSDTDSFGFAAVQSLGKHFEVYGLYRTHKYDDGLNDYKDGKGLFIGARMKFRFDVQNATFQ